MVAGSKTRARLYRGVSMMAVAAMSSALARPAMAQTARGFGIAGSATANGAAGSPSAVGITPAQQAAAARAKAMQTRSLNVRARASALQAQARDVARAALVSVPNGMKLGGLVVAPGAGNGLVTWEGASLPVQTGSADAPLVTVKQGQQKAILTWETMNVGRETTLYFDQTGGGVKANEWIALNRIEDPTARPTQILGKIKAEGQVYIINRNGVIFGGAAQVNTSSLVASALDIGNFGLSTADRDARFRAGILALDPNQGSSSTNSQVTFSLDDFNTLRDAAGAPRAASVTVEAGAQITGGTEGLVLLAGPNVTNAGSITAQNGQIILGAGLGLSLITPPAAANQIELSVDVQRPLNALDERFAPALDADGGFFEGTARNSGILSTPRGNITLAGFNVEHEGVISSTTANNRPGSVTLSARDTTGGFFRTPQEGLEYVPLGTRGGVLTLGEDSLIEIGAETGADQVVYSPDAKFQQSRILFTGGAISLERNALVLAPSATMQLGNRALQAQIFSLAEGSAIDLSGRTDVAVDIGRNIVSFEARGNELRDSPLQRDGLLNQLAKMRGEIRVDVRVGSPLVDASGAAGLIPYSVEELQTVGGSLAVVAGTMVTAKDSLISVAGGSIAYQGGMRDTTTRLVGADGRIYDIGSAPADILYTGIAGEFTRDHGRWGVTENFRSTLFGPSRVYEAGYAEGADAGSVSIEAALYADGKMDGSRILGERQNSAPIANDGNPAITRDVPKFGSLTLTTLGVGGVLDIVETANNFSGALDQTIVRGTDTLGGTTFSIASGLPDPADGGQISARDIIENFGNIDMYARSLGEGVAIDLAAGSSIKLRGADIAGSITAAGGTITIGGSLDPTSPTPTFVGGAIRSTAHLSVDGEWVNNFTAAATGARAGSSAYVNGGTINILASTGTGNSPNVVLEKGARLDLSGGGYLDQDGAFTGGNGGNLTLATFQDIKTEDLGLANPATGLIDDRGAIVTAFGVGSVGGGRGNGRGGTVSITAGRLLVGDTGAAVGLDNGVTRVNANAWADRGFSTVNLTAIRGFPYNAENIAGSILVDEGAVIAPVTTNRIVDIATALAATSGTAAASLGRIGTLDQIDRAGTAITLKADGTLYLGGADAVIRADAGSGATMPSIRLASDDSYLVEGTIDAPTGRIEINGSSYPRPFTTPVGSLVPGTDFDPTLAVWIADTARISARGLFQSSVDADGHLLGSVRDGGTVSLSGANSYLVVEQGAVIDVSGVAGSTDLIVPDRSRPLRPPRVESVALAGNAGSIDINTRLVTNPVSSGGGILGAFVDGTLIGHAGGVGARGGSLSLGAGALTNGTVSQPTGTTPVGTVVIGQSGATLADGVAFGDRIDPTLISETQLVDTNFDGVPDTEAVVNTGGSRTGRTFFSADTYAGSGFDSLQLGSATSSNALGGVFFDGDVTLDAGRMIAFNGALAGFATNADGTPRDATINLRATYVLVAAQPAFSPPPVAGATAGALTIDADFISINGNFGVRGVAQTTFDSKTDIRFVNNSQFFDFAAGIAVGGDLTLRAQQIYPATDTLAQIVSPGTVRFERADGGIGETPLSAGGVLRVTADTIVQGGVVRAPMGTIEFNPATAISFTDGSLTSVSLDGKIVPYGQLRSDRNPIGEEWYSDATLAGNGTIVIAPLIDTPPEKIISVNGATINVDAGATLDLSGGGDILAFRFIPGPGGSTDTLSRIQSGGTTATQFADGRDVYAIIPGKQPFAADRSPWINDSGTSLGTGSVTGTQTTAISPYVGDSVELKGVPGIPDGTYTLLPGRYAELPGAYRVVATPHAAGPALETPIAKAVTLPDGTIVANGYLTVNGTDLRDSRVTQFTIQSRDTWTQYSSYETALGNDFFPNRAASLDQPAARLARDAGQLSLAATQALRLNGTALFDHAADARGGLVDISAERIAITADGATYAGDGYLSLSGTQLSALGAESLLIGGRRISGTDADLIDVTAKSLIVTSGASLTAPELLLVAGPGAIDVDYDGDGIVDDSNFDGVISILRPDDGLTIAAGAKLTASGAITDARPLQLGRLEGFDPVTFSQIPALSGDSSLVRVSAGGSVPLTRINVDGALARLTIESGSSLTGNALLIDGTGVATLGGNVGIDAGTIELGASRISLGDVAGITQGLALNAGLLAQIGSAKTIVLRGRDSIDAYGDVTLGLADFGSDAIRLETGMLRGFDANVTIQADNVAWIGGAASEAGGLTPGGTLAITAKTIDLGAGAKRIEGFADTALVTTGAITGADAGSLTIGGDARIETGLLTQDSGADQTIDVAGRLTFASSATPVAVGTGLGGLLTINAAAITGGAPIAVRGGNVVMTARNGSIDFTEGRIDAGGVAVAFGEDTKLAPAGSITLTATDAVRLGAGVDLNVSAATVTGFTGSGNAGSISIAAASTQLAGTITGTAVGSGQSGQFALTSGGAVDLDPLNATLDAGGFFARRAVRSGAGDLAVGTVMRADEVSLVADGGSVRVIGTIDASGDKGGRIALAGRDGVTLADSALLDAHATGDGRGGLVEIGATRGALNLGGRINVGGDGISGSRVRLRVALADVAASQFGVGIAGARSVELEPFVTLASDTIDAGAIAGAFASVDVAAIRADKFAGSAVRITPGVEIDSAGDLSLAALSDIDLHTLRTSEGDAGVLTLRAAGDLTLLSSISDGFDGAGNLALQTDDLSWSYRFAAGAALGSADPLGTLTDIAAGDVLISAPYVDDSPTNPQIIRTGTGSIEFAAAGDIQLRDPDTVVYTAGRPIADINHVTGVDANGNPGTGYFYTPLAPTYLGAGFTGPQPTPYYPASYLRDGGDLRLTAGRDITTTLTNSRGEYLGENVNEWLWRQGAVDLVTGDFIYRPDLPARRTTSGIADAALAGSTQTSWWINLSKFNQGFGVLGGGDATVRAGRDFRGSVSIPTTARVGGGLQTTYTTQYFGDEPDPNSGGYTIITRSGITPNGGTPAVLSIDGGGDLSLDVGRDIAGGSQFYVARGTGDIRVGGSVRSDAIGVSDGYGGSFVQTFGVTLALGDSKYTVSAAGDVNLGAVVDPFTQPVGHDQFFSNKLGFYIFNSSGGFTTDGAFTSYTPDSGIDVSAIGGDLSLSNATNVFGRAGGFSALGVDTRTLRGSLDPNTNQPGVNSFLDDTLPPNVSLTAFSGDLIFPGNPDVQNTGIPGLRVDLALSSRGVLELRAAGDLLNLNIAVPDYDPGFAATVLHPSFGGPFSGDTFGSGIADVAAEFFPDAVVPVRSGDDGAVSIYAGGDIPTPILAIDTQLSLIAGGDITDMSVRIQHADATDLSVIQAGRDIGTTFDGTSFASTKDNAIEIAGGGRLRIGAGRNIYAIRRSPAQLLPGEQFGIRSIGNANDTALPDVGASIDVVFGLIGIDTAGDFLHRLLDPANVADQYTTYNIDLSDGGDGRRFIVQPDATTPMSDAALAAIYGLSAEDQRSLAIDLFFRELDASGLEVNQPGPRQGSYVRGNSAVEALFPGIDTDKNGPSTTYAGTFNLQDTTIRTEAGGDINVIGPGGDFLLGSISTVVDTDPASKGVLSVGYGNVNLFAYGDIQVGQSRVFTIDGGDILLWSSSKDINAGAGAKTVQFTPPLRTRTDVDATRTVDRVGLVTGSGIANFAPVTPIDDVQRLVDAPGDAVVAFAQTEEERRRTAPQVNLVAPIGEVDAGDAGIRSVGNLNIAALTVVNAANIDVGGQAFGVPEQAVVNVALNVDSANAAASAVTAATQAARENRQRARPSVITVQVLGFGGDFDSPEECIESADNPCPAKR